MIFRSEGDVRRWLRKAASRVWWFENKRGGSFGFPDSMVIHLGRPVFVELKLEECWHVEAHPSQLNVVQELRAAGAAAAFLAGRKGAGELALFGPGAMERVGHTSGFGGRTRYSLIKAGGGRLFDGSSVIEILGAIERNDFPDSFG